MSFVRWHQQLHAGLTLQQLAQGVSVTNIAIELGYESVSAFISMFRRMLGTTPARYFVDVNPLTSSPCSKKVLTQNHENKIETHTTNPASNIIALRKFQV